LEWKEGEEKDYDEEEERETSTYPDNPVMPSLIFPPTFLESNNVQAKYDG
jgi:hypothetical protein